MFQELLDHGARVVVLSRGMAECLQVPAETLQFLKERQIEAHALPTPQAAELYNQLAKNRAGRRVVSHNLLNQSRARQVGSANTCRQPQG